MLDFPRENPQDTDTQFAAKWTPKNYSTYHSRTVFEIVKEVLCKKNAPKTPNADQEANNVVFCPSQEKFHTVILRGVRQNFRHPVKSPWNFSRNTVFFAS